MEYTPKNILITGGSGFIGSHVVQLLVKKYPNYKIVNLDKLDYCTSPENLKSITDFPNYKFIHGNILSVDLVNYLLKEEQIDTIMHFAAQTHVDHSFANSIYFTETNVLGTHKMLEAAKTADIKRFIHVSTDEVYGETVGLMEGANKEEKVLEPTNPYAATKAGAEFLVKAYHKSFNLPTIITRGNNVYGPFQYPEKLIPKFVCLLLSNRPCCIHGEGNNFRNYVFVTDVAAAFDTILHKGTTGQVYNIGTSFEISNLQVAYDIIHIFTGDQYHSNKELTEEQKKKLQKYITFVEDRKFNDFRYKINSEKLNALGWYPKVNWIEGLEKTVEWYRHHRYSWGEAALATALEPHPITKLC